MKNEASPGFEVSSKSYCNKCDKETQPTMLCECPERFPNGSWRPLGHSSPTDGIEGIVKRAEHVDRAWLRTELTTLLHKETAAARLHAYDEGLNENWGGDRELQLDIARREGRTQVLDTLEKRIEGAKEIAPYPNASNGYMGEITTEEKCLNDGLDKAIQIIRELKQS